MIRKAAEREQAIALRKQGLSYSEIQALVPVSQGSLSLWLGPLVLTTEQRERLAHRRAAGAHHAGLVRRREREERGARLIAEAREDAVARLQVGDRLWLAGTLLYWAEGSKGRPSIGHRRVIFTNMDPSMIRIFLNYLRRSCEVGEDDIIFALQIHPGGRVEGAKSFWNRALELQGRHLRVYLKRPNSSPIRKNIDQEYYGTMRIIVRRSTALAYRIEGWRQVIVQDCGVG